jgi:tRNA(fMet)-specific endonuclease VapC
VNYLLDTNAVIAVIKNAPPGVRTRLREVLAAEASVAISTIALFELWYGVAKSARRKENTERLRASLSGSVEVFAFEEEDAVRAGELRAVLHAAGTPIGPYDLLMAAQAQRHGATLVTANVAEFARVPGLIWEDWTGT